MLMRAIVISVMLHFVVLLSLLANPRGDAQSGGGRLGFVDAVIRQAPKQTAGEVSETTRSPVMLASGSKHARNLQPPAGKAPPGKNFDFDQKFRSTASTHRGPSPTPSGAAMVSPDTEPITPVEAEIEYRLSLARLARGAVLYPEPARQRGLQGVVVVAVTGTAGNGAPSVTLERSSGADILDLRALEVVRDSVVLAPLPIGLQSMKFRISVPIEFSLTR